MENFKRGKLILAIILTIGLINLISAITVDTSNVILDSNHTSKLITFSQNISNVTILTFSLDSSIQGKAQTSLTQLSVLTSGTLTISLVSGVSNGIYYGNLNWNANDGTSGTTPIILNINNQIQQSGCQLNPSLASYNQVIQAGTRLPLPKITFNQNSECQGNLIYSDSYMYIEGGIITQSIRKPISITSIVSDGINLEINTEGLSSQTYSSKLKVNAFSKIFEIPFTIVVTTGTDVSGTFNLNDLPICSVSQTNLGLNLSYSLICTSISPDVSVVPKVDEKYIIGTGVETTESQFIWKFKPIAFTSETEIQANFFYRNSPVGNSFKQKVSITSTGTGGIGTMIKPIFSPALDKAKPGESVIIQVSENSTGSLISDAQIFVDSKMLNSTDGFTFYHTFSLNQDYEFRFRAQGYEDYISTYSLTSKFMELSISPSSGDSSTYFNISTNANSTIYLDGNIISSPYYGTITQGTHLIRATSVGYFDVEKNLTVGMGLYASLGTEFKKGIEQLVFLSSNSTWKLTYSKSFTDLEENLSQSNSVSNEVKFTPNKSGVYRIYANNIKVFENEIKGFVWKWSYALWGLIPLGLLALYLVIKKGGDSSSGGSMPGLAGNINYG